jgi:hypothetical protein
MALSLKQQYRGRKRVGSVAQGFTVAAQMAIVTSAAPDTTTMDVGLDSPVVLNGVPTSWVTTGLSPNLSPTGAVLLDATTIQLTFAGSVAAATGLTITPLDPAVRTRTGGFACAATFPIT